MFNHKLKPLHATSRYGKIDAPAGSEETLERFHDLYSRTTEGAPQIHTLILGATPELRDLVLSFGHQLTTVDRDADALHEKSAQMHYQNNPNETIVLQDWLTLDLPAATFDVILGDGVLTTLHRSEQAELLSALHDLLKPTGSLLLRESAVLHSRPRYAPSVHIHEYRSGQYSLFDLFFGLRLHNNNFKAINLETRKTYLKDFLSILADYKNDGLLSDEEFDQLNQIAQELEHTMLHKEELENIVGAVFFTKDIIHDIGSGHLSPWYFFLAQRNDPIELPDHVPSRRPVVVPAATT